MKEHKIWRQTAVLTCANAITRGAGFVLRVVLSRMLGAQAMGVMTLSHSAHMLFITPVTAGLPLAVSRITARHADARALRAGRSLVLRASAVLIPLWLLLAPLMAYALGDLRVLPSLWVFTPCLAVLGLSAVYNGFCYGLGRAWPPALSEMLEQALRFLLAAGLLLTLPQASVAWRAAMPGVATSIAEAAGLVLILSLLRRETASPPDADYAALRRELWRLSLPLCGMRLLSTALRALSGAMIPRRLVISGLTLAQATAQLGMFQGMVMPVLMAGFARNGDSTSVNSAFEALSAEAINAITSAMPSLIDKLNDGTASAEDFEQAMLKIREAEDKAGKDAWKDYFGDTAVGLKQQSALWSDAMRGIITEVSAAEDKESAFYQSLIRLSSEGVDVSGMLDQYGALGAMLLDGATSADELYAA